MFWVFILLFLGVIGAQYPGSDSTVFSMHLATPGSLMDQGKLSFVVYFRENHKKSRQRYAYAGK